MRHGRPLLAALAVVLTLACKDQPSEEVSGLIDDYDYERDGSRSLLCSCPSELGYASEAECEAGLGDIGASEKQCMLDALADNESLAVDYLECTVAAQAAFRDCLNQYLSCEPDWFTTCDAEQADALAACPTLPADVEAAFDACL